MKTLKRKEYKLELTVYIETANTYLANDVVLLDLRLAANSKYTTEAFIQEIEKGNVIVAMLNDDPVAYAVIKEGKIDEYYIDYSLKETELENIIKNLPIN